MKRTLAVLALLAASTLASADVTLNQSLTQAEGWVVARQAAILNEVEACISRGTPRLCHTAWAASVLPNTAPTDNSLATVTLDDPGRLDPCGLPTEEGTYATAKITIPATAPLNAKLNIAKGPGGWGAQLVVRIQYDGVVYERAWGRGIFAGFAWRSVE